jgi:hypothetical protein
MQYLTQIHLRHNICVKGTNECLDCAQLNRSRDQFVLLLDFGSKLGEQTL